MSATAPGARHQVVAAALVRGGQILLCHRAAERRWYPNVWDLPGGHLEPGESAIAALTRELGEELGIAPDPARTRELGRLTASDLELSVWIVRDWTGVLRNAAPDEHDALAWFEAGEIAELDLAHADYAALLAEVLAP